jgi:hypothetical protein
MGIIIWLVVGGICGWLASLIMRTDAQQTAGDGGHHFGLATHDPARRPDRRQRLDGQRLAERSDDLGRTNLLVLEHSVTPA